MADGLLNKASIILTPTGYKAGTLYNVAPVVEPYEDFDFARASVASRVNSSGLVEMVGRTLGSELVTNGDFSTSGTPNTSSFTLGWYSNTSNVIIENGSLTMSNSASQSDSRAYATNGVSSNNILTTNKTYELKYDIIENNGVTNFKYYSSSGVFISAPSLEIGSYTIYIKNTSNQLFLFQNSSTNSSIKIDNVSLKEIIDTNNIPRISYDSNGDNGHILLEPTSTNLLPYSEDFSEWTATDCSILSGFTAPDGSNTAYKVSNIAAPDGILYYSGASASNYTKTIYARTVSGTGTAQLLSHNANTNNTFNLTETWQRFEVNSTTNVPSIFYAIDFRGSGTLDEVLIWGAQSEDLSYATSYIPTLTGSTETRATETATGAGSADLINSTEGVLYAEIASLTSDVDSEARIVLASSGDTNNSLRLYYNTTQDTIEYKCRVSSSNVCDITYDLGNSTQFHKIACKWKQNDFALWVDGVEVGTDTSGSTFSADTLNVLNFSNATTLSDFFYGKCKALAVFNEALSDDELNNLTG